MTPTGDVQCRKHHAKSTLQNKAPREDVEDGTSTCREEVNGTANIGNLMAREIAIGDVLKIHKTFYRDKIGQKDLAVEHRTSRGRVQHFWFRH